jgi:hypothetical protein
MELLLKRVVLSLHKNSIRLATRNFKKQSNQHEYYYWY